MAVVVPREVEEIEIPVSRAASYEVLQVRGSEINLNMPCVSHMHVT